MLTTDEKMDIIYSWCKMFIIRYPVIGGGMHGVIEFNNGISLATKNRTNTDDTIDEAYDIIYNFIAVSVGV